MELSKREKKTKYIVYCLLIAAAALLQNVGGLWLEIGKARCFFVIPVSLILAIGEDEKVSALLGLFAGLLWDAVSAQHMGFNCIFLMFFCYVSSTLVTFVFRDTFWIEFSGAALCAFSYSLLYWLLFVVSRGGEGSAASFLKFYLPCFVYTTVMTPVLYFILSPVKRKLNKETAEA